MVVRRNIEWKNCHIEGDLDTFTTNRRYCIVVRILGKTFDRECIHMNTCVHSVAPAASSSTPTTFVKLVGLVALVPRDCISRSPTSTIVFIEAHSPSLFWPAARVVCCISQMDNLNVMLELYHRVSSRISRYRLEMRSSFLLFFSFFFYRENGLFLSFVCIQQSVQKRLAEYGFFSFRVKFAWLFTRVRFNCTRPSVDISLITGERCFSFQHATI